MNRRCREEPGCGEAFPDIVGDLRAVMKNLEDAPEIAVSHPRLGERRSLTITPRRLSRSPLRGLLYAPELVSLLPLALADARRGYFDPFVTQAFYLGDEQRDAISLGLFLSLVCSEDVPRITDAEVDAQTKGHDPVRRDDPIVPGRLPRLADGTDARGSRRAGEGQRARARAQWTARSGDARRAGRSTFSST